jgi:hypothetical protein
MMTHTGLENGVNLSNDLTPGWNMELSPLALGNFIPGTSMTVITEPLTTSINLILESNLGPKAINMHKHNLRLLTTMGPQTQTV